MSNQDAQQLRELVGDYYHGLITRESYRQQRAMLLDNIRTPLESDLEITRKSQRRQRPTTKDNRPRSTTRGSSAKRGPRGLAVGGVAILVIGLAVALITRTPESDQSKNNPLQQGEVSGQVGTNRSDLLLEEFLSRNDWSNSSLASFADGWRGLDDQQAEQSKAGLQFRRLTNALNRRLGEKFALGIAETDSGMIALTDFATALNIAIRRPQSAMVDTQDVSNAIPDPGEETNSVVDVAPTDDTESELLVEVQANVVESGSDSNVDTPSEIIASDKSVAEVAPSEDADPVPADRNVSMPRQPAIAVSADRVESTLAENSALNAEKKTIAAKDDPCQARIARSRRPYCQDVLADGSKGPPLVVLTTGEFEMGSDRNDTEGPLHKVSIDSAIAMSRYEVTVAEFEHFCESANLPCPNGYAGDDNFPIVLISWNDAVLYTEWLSAVSGFNYRLPSEAEWEFAARAGTQSPYFFGDEITPSNAHSSANGGTDSPLPRSDRSINRNPFRLYHMSGNVREWVQDSWYANYENAPTNGSARANKIENRRVVRGGSYADPGSKLRSAAREPLDRSHRDILTGIRIIREIIQ